MDQYIGKMLDNRYEILERIGTGGMAVVYKAKCHRLNRLVAIKILKSDLAQDEDFRRRFNAESQAVAQLSHPNIVSVYDVSKGGDVEYIVMELIDGITLKQYMEKRGQLNWRESLHFITQIMRGLSHAHSRGIVHRDIKPQNIMVLRDGSVKVADFGIACLENSAQTLTQEALGSVHYISPEQAKGDRTDARSDIYSAGVVLYEMLTNRLPFEGDSAVSVAIQHLSSIPLAPREINSEIPEPLELICMKAMAPDLERRYSSADAMINDLEAFRKNPGVDLDISMEELHPEVPDEPTRLIHTAPRGTSTSGGYHSLREPAPDRGRESDREYSRNYRNFDKEQEYDRRPEPSKGQKNKRIAAISVGTVIILAVLFFLARSVLASLGGGDTYTVPNVCGHTVEEAQAMDGVKDIFEINQVGTEPSDEYAAGLIMKQDPAADTTKKSDLVINVTVSSGADEGVIPDGLDNQDAQTVEKVLLKDLTEKYDLNVQRQEEYNEDITAGYVISTDPAAGEKVKKGDTVTLVVSKGPEIPQVTVLPFVGLPIDKVQAQLTNAGLVGGQVTEQESDEPEGTVLEQSLKSGTQVPKGTTIDFVVSSGKKNGNNKDTTNTLTETFALPTDGRESVHAQVYQDGTLVYDETVPTSQGSIAVELTGTGTSDIEVHYDGVTAITRQVNFDE